MRRLRWLDKLFHDSRRPNGGATAARRPRTLPSIELLEDRTAPAILTVSTLSDQNALGSGTGLSLREAIAVVNAGSTAGLDASELAQIDTGTNPLGTNDVIQFDPGLLFFGPATITLGSALPGLASNVSIQGPGADQLTVQRDTNADSFGIFTVDTGVTAALSGLTISGGSAFFGGGIFNHGTLTVSGSTLSGNTAADGGAIDNYGGTLTVSNSTFSGNSADSGGGIDNDSGTLTVNGSTFSGNSATDGGGGIANRGTLTVNGSTFSNNSAGNNIFSGFSAYGGGIDDDGGTLTVNGSAFSNNSVGSSGYGGGIYGYSDTMLISGSTFSGNSAGVAGGGLDIDSHTVVVSGSTFAGNSAADGGGIYNYGSTLTVSNSTLSGNSASNGGGGIANTGTLTVNGCTLAGNSAVSAGGLASLSGGTVLLRDSLIARNTSAGSTPDDVDGQVLSTSSNNLIGCGANLTGISENDANGNFVGTVNNPLDPGLDPNGPQDNGGPTQTIALLSTSPALGNGGAATLDTLQDSITAADTTLVVGNAAAFAPGMVLRLDSELVTVVSADPYANTLVVSRGIDDTTPAGHAQGAGLSLGTDQRGIVRPVGLIDVGAFQAERPPTVSDVNKDLIENGTLSFAAADFSGAYSDPEGIALHSIEVVSLPSSGTLKLTGLVASLGFGILFPVPDITVTAGQVIDAADLGHLVYTPNAGFNGNDNFTWTASDGAAFSTTQALVQITVLPLQPATVSVTDPGGTFNGAPFLASATVNGDSSVEGVSPTLTYYQGSSAGGTPLNGPPVLAGTYTVVASFPGSTSFAAASAQTTFTIAPATPTIFWANPAAITYGMRLSPVQLDAVAFVPGSFSYTPEPGTLLGAGTQTLSATFTPFDRVDYTTATATATLVVNPATPAVAVSDAGGTYDGQPFAATATVNGAASLEGVSPTLTYYAGSSASGTPLAGAPVTAGTYTVVAAFPGSADYAAASAQATFTIAPATPTITWADPAAITVGTPLSSTQLDATAAVAGSFSYTPAAGTVLDSGIQSLSATFTPADLTDYSTATAGVALVVNPAPPVTVAAAVVNAAPPAASTLQQEWITQVYQVVFGVVPDSVSVAQALGQLQSQTDFGVVLTLLGNRRLRRGYQLRVLEALYLQLRGGSTPAELRRALAFLNHHGHSFETFAEHVLGVPKALARQELVAALVPLYIGPGASLAGLSPLDGLPDAEVVAALVTSPAFYASLPG